MFYIRLLSKLKIQLYIEHFKIISSAHESEILTISTSSLKLTQSTVSISSSYMFRNIFSKLNHASFEFKRSKRASVDSTLLTCQNSIIDLIVDSNSISESNSFVLESISSSYIVNNFVIVNNAKIESMSNANFDIKKKEWAKSSTVKYDWQEIYNLIIKFKKEVIEHYREHNKWSNVARLFFHDDNVTKSKNLIVIFDIKIKVYFYQIFDAFVMLEMKMILNER